jgi:transporter family protein
MFNAAFYLAITTAVIWGIVPLMEKAGLRDAPPLGGLFARSLGVVFGLIAITLFLPGVKEFSKVPLKNILILACGGFLASFVGQMLFYRALKQGNVSTVVPLAASYPLITFILGIALFGESISFLRVLGVLCIVAGIILLK